MLGLFNTFPGTLSYDEAVATEKATEVFSTAGREQTDMK